MEYFQLALVIAVLIATTSNAKKLNEIQKKIKWVKWNQTNNPKEGGPTWSPFLCAKGVGFIPLHLSNRSPFFSGRSPKN